MNKNIKQNYQNKINEFKKHNKLYYENSSPTISDKEFDKLKKEILELEKKNKPEFINFNNNYYVAEVLNEKDMVLILKDQELKKTIIAQLKINFIIKENVKF